MGLFANFRKKRALKRYGSELPQRLSHDYGAGEFHTPAQIRVAVRKLALDPAFIAYAYAMYLPEAAFNGLRGDMPNAPDYEDARAEFRDLLPSQFRDDSGYYDCKTGQGR